MVDNSQESMGIPASCLVAEQSLEKAAKKNQKEETTLRRTPTEHEAEDNEATPEEATGTVHLSMSSLYEVECRYRYRQVPRYNI